MVELAAGAAGGPTTTSSGTRSTSSSGSGATPASRRGARGGGLAGPAGTSSAQRWRCGSSARRSTCTVAVADLVFPHHESESALAEAATGGPFVRHWLHVEMVAMAGAKMSKSTGNLAFVDALRKEWDAAAIRLGIDEDDYRTEWEWDAELMPQAQLESWREAARRGGATVDVLSAVRERLDDDLDTPAALAAIDEACAGGSGDGVAAAADLLGVLL